MRNHYECNVDVTQDPFYCSDHQVFLTDNGNELTTTKSSKEYEDIA